MPWPEVSDDFSGVEPGSAAGGAASSAADIGGDFGLGRQFGSFRNHA